MGPIDFMAGSSIGVLVGALYASGVDGAGLRRIAATVWPVLRRAGAPPRRGGASLPATGGQPLLVTTGVTQWRRSSLLLL